MGSHLTAELLREGCSVRLIVRNAGKTDLLKATLRRMGVADRYDRIEFRQTALNNPHTLREAVRGTQVLFHCAAQPGSRSDMNVTFRTDSAELDAKFVAESAEWGFSNLKGHRKVGGMRASIYNAMPIEGVEKLCEFIKHFDQTN